MDKQELIYQQTISNQKEEIAKLKEQLERDKELIAMLQEQADLKGMDMIAYVKEFETTMEEAKSYVNEAKELRNTLILEKAKYQELVEEALRNILGPNM